MWAAFTSLVVDIILWLVHVTEYWTLIGGWERPCCQHSIVGEVDCKHQSESDANLVSQTQYFLKYFQTSWNILNSHKIFSNISSQPCPGRPSDWRATTGGGGTEGPHTSRCSFFSFSVFLKITEIWNNVKIDGESVRYHEGGRATIDQTVQYGQFSQAPDILRWILVYFILFQFRNILKEGHRERQL